MFGLYIERQVGQCAHIPGGAHIAQGEGWPIEKWLRNQIFMDRLPLFRDQLAPAFVRLRLRTYLIGPPLFTAPNMNLIYFLRYKTYTGCCAEFANVITR